MKSLRVLIGLFSWLAAIGGIWWCIDHRLMAGNTDGRRPAAEVWSYFMGNREHVLLQIVDTGGPLPTLGRGDPIFMDDGERGFRQVGEVTSLLADGGSRRTGEMATAEALFYPAALELSSSHELAWYDTPNSMDWVISTMLPPPKREAVAAKIAMAMETHRHEIMAALQPIVQASLQDAMTVIEEDLSNAIAGHRDELQELGARYQAEVVQEELIPLARKEIWPIVRRSAEPTASKIGKGLWKRISIWRFSWRYIYDKVPMSGQSRVADEWKRFVDDEAMPELELHTEEMVDVVKTVLLETAKNAKVRAAMRENMLRLLEDPEVHRIVEAIVLEVIVENPRVRKVFQKHWQSPAAQRAFQIASSRLDPTVQEIGQLLFGTPERISPEFKRVLRNRILNKDKRWLVVRQRDRSIDEKQSDSSGGDAPLKLLVYRADGDVFPIADEP